MHHFLLFLYVARFGGRCTYRQLEDALDLTNSSVSRTVNALGAEHRNGKPGIGLLTTYSDPDEGRRMIVTFTPKGSALVRQLQSIQLEDHRRIRTKQNTSRRSLRSV
jgi:DNA-binding MarR family transcriptional regulator